MFRLANFNLVKKIQSKQVICFRLNSSESAKNALENSEIPKTPASPKDNINQTPQQSKLSKHLSYSFRIFF